MIFKKSNIFLIYIYLLIFLNCKDDPSTFANIQQIIQTNVEANFNIDFDNQVIHGLLKIYFNSLMDGEVIVLDTKNLKIFSIIDSDTGEELEWELDTIHSLDALGIPLKIYKEYKKDDIVTILIKYDTTKEGQAVQFLSKEITSSGQPFMFTQCESIYCRSLLPIQDTPAAKITVSMGITVVKPLKALDSGLFTGSIDNGDTMTFFYEQNIPIPSYLIALAAGDIKERKISDRTTVYGESAIVDKAAKEFVDTEKFVEYAESYTIPYVWGQYNILVLPPSFPFGGMENPTLTFATPSIVAGDRSLVDVIAHEISHSWSGNLVTMRAWNDFWLNEGFTMFIQRKIIEKAYNNSDMAKLDAMFSYHTMVEDINSMGAGKSFSSLRPFLIGKNPDDAFSEIPYEKGFNFLYYMENIVITVAKKYGKEEDYFKLMLKEYFTKYKFQAITYIEFKAHFEEFIKQNLDQEPADEIINSIDWNSWLFEPGIPKYQNNFNNSLADTIQEYVNKFFNETLESELEEFMNVFKNEWVTLQKQYFLRTVYDRSLNNPLNQSQIDILYKNLTLYSGYNAEVNFEFFKIILQNVPDDDDWYDYLKTFLGSFGRMKYIRPLYIGLAKINKAKALEFFDELKKYYHPIAIKYVELDLKKII